VQLRQSAEEKYDGVGNYRPLKNIGVGEEIIIILQWFHILIILYYNVQDQMPGDIIHEHAEALGTSAEYLAIQTRHATHMVGDRLDRNTRDPSW
jgi:hypothetical protein